MNSFRALQALQRGLYRMLEARADLVLGEAPPAINHYEKEYQKDFKFLTLKKPVWQDKTRLIEAIRNADVTWIGDYHTFGQSQRTALRIIRSAVQPGEDWAIGVELIHSGHQSHIDAYQRGDLSTEEFHDRVNYHEEWGFPWAHYAPIFEWARDMGVRILALNRPKLLALSSTTLRRGKSERDLFERDRWAAGIVTDAYLKGASPRLIVLYGELHVGSRHLPRCLADIAKKTLKRPLKQVVVYQNNDPLYWKLGRTLHHQSVLKLPRLVPDHRHLTRFYVASSTPWARLQSLVSWAEGDPLRQHTHELSDGSEKWDDDWEDPTHDQCLTSVHDYSRNLSRLLSVPEPTFELFTLHTAEQADFTDRIKKNHSLSTVEYQLVKLLVQNHHRLYIPRLQIAYLSSPSENGAAEIAALHLFRTRTRLGTFAFEGDPSILTDLFYIHVIENAFGYLGSLLINPKRKCDLLFDHQQRLRHLAEGAKPFYRYETETRRLTCHLLQKTTRAGLSRAAVLQAWKSTPLLLGNGLKFQATWYLSARAIGSVLGLKLHQAILANEVTIHRVRHLCLSRTDGEGRAYSERYAELWQATSGVRLPKSKDDWL